MLIRSDLSTKKGDGRRESIYPHLREVAMFHVNLSI